jgi:outer membrane protein assembly factor BamB
MKTSALIFLLLCAPGLILADDWLQFRGSSGDGIANVTNLPTHWTESENVTWKVEIPGKGWSSPVVSQGEIWLTTAIATEMSEEEQAEKTANAMSQGLKAFKRVSLFAVQIDLKSGKLNQKVKLFDISDPPLIHELNSFASPTPVISGDHVYVNFGTFGTACVRRSDGEIVWKRNDINIDHETGPGSSPIIWNDLVILHFDGIDKQFITALDTKTGKTRWQTKRSGEMHTSPMMRKSFATPLVVEQNGNEVIISPAANWVYAYEPATGKELWKTSYGKLGFSCVPRPIADQNTVYVCTSFTQSCLLALDMADNSDAGAPIKWEFRQQVPNISSPILVDGHIYFTSDRGIASCVDAQSGTLLWRERLPGDVSASPVFGDGKIYFCNRNGETFVVEPGKKFSLLATNKLDSRIMSSPAIIDSSLVIRTEKYLYRIE